MKRYMVGAVSVFFAAALFIVPSSHAQSTNDPGIQQRMQNQERRIDQGVNSGQLTPKETGQGGSRAGEDQAG